jgi:two-component system CheB/CheR fusion protein
MEEKVVTTSRDASEKRIGGRRILVIEDNRDAAKALGMVLRIQGHDVTLAYDGAEGLEKVHELHPDVVLCDIGLPGLDGYEVARSVRGDPSLASTYLVALSGYASREDGHRATEAGFDVHLAKPLSIDRLAGIFRGLPSRA